MNAFAKGIMGIFIVAGAMAIAAPFSSEHPQPSVSEIAAHFTNYYRVTASVVYVNPELAMLCRGATKEEVESARVKFGPHANTGILVYMNKAATDAFTTNSSSFPVGSVIVKQKTIHGDFDKLGGRGQEADTGVGGMVKRPSGYDPKNGDWEYFYFENPKKVEGGRISSCVQCHAAAKDKDYVFGTWRTTGAQ